LDICWSRIKIVCNNPKDLMEKTKRRIQEEEKMLEIGTLAPDFSLPDQNGKIHTLSQYRGKRVILYFYPKDNTSG